MNAVDEQSGGAERETAEVAIPEFYVALDLLDDGDDSGPGQRFAPRTEAVVRGTATGNVLAAIAPPPPYGTFVGVTAAADHRTFVLAAQMLARLPVIAACRDPVRAARQPGSSCCASTRPAGRKPSGRG